MLGRLIHFISSSQHTFYLFPCYLKPTLVLIIIITNLKTAAKKKEYPEFARVLTKQKNKILMISFKIKQTQNYRDKSYKVVSFDSKRTNGNYASNPPKI